MAVQIGVEPAGRQLLRCGASVRWFCAAGGGMDRRRPGDLSVTTHCDESGPGCGDVSPGQRRLKQSGKNGKQDEHGVRVRVNGKVTRLKLVYRQPGGALEAASPRPLSLCDACHGAFGGFRKFRHSFRQRPPPEFPPQRPTARSCAPGRARCAWRNRAPGPRGRPRSKACRRCGCGCSRC